MSRWVSVELRRSLAWFDAGCGLPVPAVGGIAHACSIHGNHVGRGAGRTVGAQRAGTSYAVRMALADGHDNLPDSPLIVGADEIVVGADSIGAGSSGRVVPAREEGNHIVVPVVAAELLSNGTVNVIDPRVVGDASGILDGDCGRSGPFINEDDLEPEVDGPVVGDSSQRSGTELEVVGRVRCCIVEAEQIVTAADVSVGLRRR